MGRRGKIVKIVGNLVAVEFAEAVYQNEVAYILHNEEKLKSEVIRIRGNIAELQVYERTEGLKIGEEVEFTGELLSADLGPGLLGQIFDGLQNPLSLLAEKYGFFLKRGAYLKALPEENFWEFIPLAKKGEKVKAGDRLGYVFEKIFKHYIMVPFSFPGIFEVEEIVPEGKYNFKQPIAYLKKEDKVYEVFMKQSWPVKIPIRAYRERLSPQKTLVTKIRLIDSLFPIALGGTYCIPGPFGSGKTVLQQLISKHAEIDIVVIAACGERAGEVVEVLRTFPELTDPRTGKLLIDRTIIICNTSAMPVAARESSVYTAVTLAEYYRQMGLNVLLLADSTSRWAQAMREISGRLEEIPGEEAFPAYLESRIAAFYERAGVVRLNDGSIGSVTIGGTVSPAGGNFEEPVTQATLKVVGAFLGLSRERAEARKYPAIDPLISWSKYKSFIEEERVSFIHSVLRRANDIYQMMKVVGEEGITLEDYIEYLKGEFFDYVYLQQYAFDPVDEATTQERQKYIFDFIYEKIIQEEFLLENKENALKFFQKLRQLFKTWNSEIWQSAGFKDLDREIREFLNERRKVKSNV
ncbi:MAG: V-type ATP synthase subunit A [Candidatus Omnitrophica bacterium]|nr:V-type ATP synthase subunit A [Candidatus Omnitrophota bacterium]